jgi:hypothetical protein
MYRFGRQEKKLRAQQRKGKKIKALERKPNLTPSLAPIYRAFLFLSARRVSEPYQFTKDGKIHTTKFYQFIPLAEINLHLDALKVYEFERKYWIAILTHCDEVWMKCYAGP